MQGALERAATYRNAGRLSDVEQTCRAVLKRYPKNPDALWLLGTICYQRGRGDEAQVMLSRAVDTVLSNNRTPPLDWRLTLGAVQQRTGAQRQALRTFEAAAEEHPESADALFCLATALHSLDSPEEAIDRYRAVLYLDPANAAAANNLGVLLRDRGDVTGAARAFRQALSAHPGYHDTMANYGELLQRAGYFTEARRYLLRATNDAPDDMELQRVLAQNEVYLGDVPAAAARLEELLQNRPDDPAVLTHLASIRLYQGRKMDAVALCTKALSIDRSNAPAHFYLAGAEHDLENPSRLRQIRRALKAPGISENDKALLYFAAADRLDGNGRYGEAFEWYRRGNEVRRRALAAQGVRYDRADHDGFVDAVVALFGHNAFSKNGQESLSTQPVFIVGMPRSGTSLVEQIISTHPKVGGGGELTLVGEEAGRLSATIGYPRQRPRPSDIQNFVARYTRKLSEVGAGKERVTDKKPMNFLHLGLIAMAFPHARVIHCRRDRRDILLSCYSQNFAGPGQPFSYDLEDLEHYHAAYLRIMEHWREVLPLAIFDVDYETLVADQESESKRLLAFLGLDWDPACLEFYRNMRPVVTASHTQVRQPI
jgi:tetratricopeptide (TPR) repeat protein